MFSKSLVGVVFVGLICLVQAKKLCEEDPNFESAQVRLKKIEQDLYAVKLKAEAKIVQLKTRGGTNLEHFEKEYSNFIKNYTALMQLIEQKPSFCERVIQELEDSINYFTQHILLSA